MDPRLIFQLGVYGLTDGAVVALNAAGFTLAYAVSRQINLAHGSVFALTTVVVASLTSAMGVTTASPLAVRIAGLLMLATVGAITGAALNATVERVAFRPFRGVRDPLGPLISSVAVSFILLQTLSRYREFAADRGSAIITGRPSALISALMKISGTMGRIPQQDLRAASGELAAFYIFPPKAKQTVTSLFSTHPPLEARIAALQRLEAQLQGTA